MIIDLHVHTPPLSGDSTIELPDFIEKAKKSGIDGVCLTEHDKFHDHSEVAELGRKYDFLMLPGAEIWSDDNHFLVFGLDEYSFGVWMAYKLREKVEEAGGVMILAHPSRRQYSREGDLEADLDRYCKQSFLRYVDMIEVMNGRSEDRGNLFSRKLGERLGFPGTGGSDAHSIDDIPSFATEFSREIHSLEELIAELKAGRFRAVDLR